MEKAIELEGITKRLGDFNLGPLSFSIPSGSIVGYIGENGAGKSTTIKLLLGLMKPDSGKIKILGNPIAKSDAHQKKDVAYVFDDLFLLGTMTIKSVQTFHKLLYGEAWQEKTFYRLVESFQLPKKKRIKHFSRGMKMQLGIAIALSHGQNYYYWTKPLAA